MTRSGALVAAALSAALCALAYVLAVGTSAGRAIDDAGLLKHDEALALPRVHDATETIVHTIDRGSLAILGIALVAVAMARGRTRTALAALISIAGANLTTQALKRILGSTDPLGGDALRVFEGSFPSGHATVAMSLALALLLVVPRPWRLAAALAGIGYTAAIGVGMLALGWHFPSDVVGGYLVATAWAALAVAVARPEREPPVPGGRERRRTLWLLGGAGALLAGLFAVVAVATAPELLVYGRLRTTFVAGGLLIAALATVLVASAAVALSRSPTRIRRTMGVEAPQP